MRRLPILRPVVGALASFGCLAAAGADTLELTDGTVIENCYVRDDGVRLLLWRSLQDVGGPGEAIPRSRVKSFKIERGDDWDAHPDLPDLSVTFIELNPKLAGLHGLVQYDKWGRPKPGGGPLPDTGERGFMNPGEIVKGMKFQYDPGQQVTLTAHVKNLGFATAAPFEYRWLIDGEEVGRGAFFGSLEEMEEATFTLKWFWQPGRHPATFKIITDQTEIATRNNEATDPLWGYSFFYIVHKGRVDAWHQNRTAYGTFSFEDFYRWHIDIMNLLFERSVFPSAPEGIIARVRLDRIIYTDDVDEAVKQRLQGGVGYDQGGWTWLNDEDRKREWKPPTHQWRNQTEWSLPHELGHQLGLTDLYGLDYAGHERHVTPDTGEKVTHFMTHPTTMMHWHGPHVWSELDAGYLNMTWNKPRGYYGDFYFAIPRECFLRIVDVNGEGVPGAKVEIFQRGAVVDPNGKPGEDRGVTYFPLVEDGNFGHPVSQDPVIIGTTGEEGVMRLPNRPVKEVVTLNGFERRPNPFGNINVVGQRGLMLVRVTKNDRPCYYWLEIFDFNVAWFRGHKNRYTVTLKTPYASVNSPMPPRNVRVEILDKDHVRVTWDAPDVPRERNYIDKTIAFTVFRRIGNDGLNDRPWFPVATVGPDKREVVVDLREFTEDVYWYSKSSRFAVATVGDLGLRSELVEVVLPSPSQTSR
ncbi:MAG: hypothetical protein IH851_06785 [Armatimonadetes bacterium]|nr:hypothetical protein [Armatimonadota bacterium]